jgi:DNA-binding MarR family transcriptional regulator
MKNEEMVVQVLMAFPLFMHKVFHDLRGEAEGHPLNRTQMKTLMIIHLENQPHMTHVCHHMNMEKGSLTPVIDSLIEMGLVDRMRNREDRRKVNLSLTEKGNRLVIEHLNQAHDHLLKKLESLPEANVSRFKRAITDLYEIAQKL